MALSDKELAIEDVAEEIKLLAAEIEELATSERLEAEFEMAEAADLTPSETFAATPGSSP